MPASTARFTLTLLSFAHPMFLTIVPLVPRTCEIGEPLPRGARNIDRSQLASGPTVLARSGTDPRCLAAEPLARQKWHLDEITILVCVRDIL